MTYRDHLGRQEVLGDMLSAQVAERMAATLGEPLAAFGPEGELPPLWHWLFFQSWVPVAELGPDGHPRRGGFLPPVHDLPRRMWAGGRLRFLRPLRLGDAVTRTSTVADIREKTGRSGRLVFVLVRHEIAGPAGVAIVEEHDIVYRSVGGTAVKPGLPAPPPAAGSTVRRLVPDPVLLFRYSALTGNGHRIHYDLDYVRGIEGYPGLVVHGPLLATLLVSLVREIAPGRRIASFAFRGERPAFHDRPLTFAGHDDGGTLRLACRDHEEAVVMTAEAVLAATAGPAPAP